MTNSQNSTNRRKALVFAKWLLMVFFVLLFCLNIYDLRMDLHVALSAIFEGAHFPFGAWGLLAAELLLFSLNIGIAATRWKLLTQTPEKSVSFKHAFMTELSALSLANLTPMGLGEYYARLSGTDEHTKYSATAATALGQWTAAIVLGLIGTAAVWFSGFRVAFGGAICLTACAILGCTVVGIIWLKNKQKVRILGKDFSTDISHGYWVSSGLSALRECVYTLQTMLLIYSAEGCGACFGIGYLLCLVYYLFVQLIPAFGLLDVCPKGGVALLVLGSIFDQGAVISAVMGVWLINCVMPTAAWCSYVALRYVRRKVL